MKLKYFRQNKNNKHSDVNFYLADTKNIVP